MGLVVVLAVQEVEIVDLSCWPKMRLLKVEKRCRLSLQKVLLVVGLLEL